MREGRRRRLARPVSRRSPAPGAASGNGGEGEDLAAALAEVARLLHAAGLPGGPGCLAGFRAYLETLQVWRRAVSLTATRTLLGIVREHVADSLHIARFLQPGVRLADLGSGAGFPGLPVAIVRPDVQVTLIEARRKRANFLRDAVRRAGLTNTVVVEGRIEAGRAAPCGPVDVVVGRAFGTIDRFLGCAATLLAPGGVALLMKGPQGVVEAAAARAQGYEKPEVTAYRLPGGAGRTLLAYRRC